jgi:hypothetical protein
MMLKQALVVILSLCSIAAPAAADQVPAAGNPPRSDPAAAERIYAVAQTKLLQVRTLLIAAGRQSVIGSGFMVSADGLAITNYHVVSQYALEPKFYRLEYFAADGSHGDLQLLAIDLANDLAVVRRKDRDQPFFEFDERAVRSNTVRGERLYSMGNPLDLGFTIVEGTYNGLVERSYNERIHFSGALNPGMSGGPAVTAEGRVAGINVAKQLSGELVSFLVPARFAAALLERARGLTEPPQDFRAEIGRQLTIWQAGLYQAIDQVGFRTTKAGPYQAPESAARWFTCWARTNADDTPKPRAVADTTICSGDTRLFIAGDLSTGAVSLAHSYYKSVDLNQFQFAAFLSKQNQSTWLGERNRKWHTQQRCHEDFIAGSAPGERPPLRLVWCARAYREFKDLYDVWVMAITQDHSNETLVSRLGMQGITYDNAIAVTKRFVDAVRWAK